MTCLPLFVLCLVLPAMIYASKMCVEDDDCADLGDVFCMKSRCKWGICGCPRGQAMRFLGSEKLFQCVPINRVGEPCSPDGERGVCGAANADCVDGRCICNHSSSASPKRWSYWGGERCEEQHKSTDGETCSTGASLGSCSLTSSFAGCKSGNTYGLLNNKVDYPLDTVPNTCGCQPGYRVALVNDLEFHDFTGKTRPTCVKIKFGELCLINADCQQATMECKNNKCACKTAGEVPDFAGTTCAKPLGSGTLCYTTDPATPAIDGHCDGTQFLVCGDVCEASYLNTTLNRVCTCDHSYGGPGGGCSAATEGSACETDIQCKSLSRTGVCVDGACKAGARVITGSLLILLVALLVSLKVIS